jgi:hypothetical protein
MMRAVPTGSELLRRVSIRMEVEQEKQKLENIVANKENLKPLELTLQKIELIASDIRLDMVYMREREAQHRNANGLCVLCFMSFSPPLLRSTSFTSNSHIKYVLFMSLDIAWFQKRRMHVWHGSQFSLSLC